jgi:hypothetical protein
VQRIRFAEDAAGFVGVANERSDRIAAPKPRSVDEGGGSGVGRVVIT